MDADDVCEQMEDAFAAFDDLEPLRYSNQNTLLDARGTAELSALSASVDKLVALLASNNQIAAFASSDTTQAIANIKQGAELVKAGVFTVKKLEAAFYGASAYLATKFAEVPVGEAAQAVWSCVLNLVRTLGVL